MKRTLKHQTESRRGVALVIVLSVLVLLSALIIGFMTSVSTERTATSVNSALISARQLNDTAVNLVIEQIREATSCYKPGLQEPDESATWASQPGLITVLSGRIGTRKPLNSAHDWTYRPGSNDFVFKLYSADKFKLSIGDYFGGDLRKETDFIKAYDPNDPRALTDYMDWADLNEPLVIPVDSKSEDDLVETRYPIINPAARYDANGDRPANTNGIVEGFDCKKFEHPTAKQKLRKPDGSYAQTKVPLLPMPVRWLYQLKDGTLSASLNGRVAKASKDNPIVGRMAFWTDDESCKINVNTASEGTFWDTPTASSIFESGRVERNGTLTTKPTSKGQYHYVANLSASQPVRGEYQRYPGHPATTCLSPVLGWLWGLDTNKMTSEALVSEEFKEAIASMAPFIPHGTAPAISKFGSVTTRGGFINPDPLTPLPSALKPGEQSILNVPTRHLYATIDEYLLNADRFNLGSTLEDNKRNPLALLNGKDIASGKGMSADALDRVRFALTANSRSPELNLFSRPRVTFWPVSSDLNYRTAYDELFSFTSSIGGFNKTTGQVEPGNVKRFFFTRWDSRNNVNDYSQLPTPGQYAGVKPDVNLKDQNRMMRKYLEAVTGGIEGGGATGGIPTEIPGFGGCFLAKYPQPAGALASERTQILCEIMDYTRAINIVDTGEGKVAGVYLPYTPRFFPKPEWEFTNVYNRNQRSVDWSGQVTPLIFPSSGEENSLDPKIPATMGQGRFVVISDAAIVFYRTNPPAGAAGGTYIQAALIMQIATTMPGFPALRETFFTRVRENPGQRNKITVKSATDTSPKYNRTEMGFSTTPLININNIASQEVGYGRGFMPTLGFHSQLHFMPAHTSPTSISQAGRNPTLTVRAKTLSSKDVSSAVYTRGKTETFYPYVSEPIDISWPSAPASESEKVYPQFTWEGGTFDVELFAGEAPSAFGGVVKGDDPKASRQPVQRVTLAFPPTPITFQKVTNASTPLPNRLTGSLDGAWNIFTDADVSRGIEYVGTDINGLPLPAHSANGPGQRGDLRIAASRPVLLAADYRPREEGASSNYFTPSIRLLHGLRTGHGDACTGFASPNQPWGKLGKNSVIRTSKPPILPVGLNGVITYNGVPGDWDRGLSKHMSGAFSNKVDEGNIFFRYDDGSDSGVLPYFRGRAIEETGQSFFSPNRQVSSAIMFGSLPTGVLHRRPWQTLLFRPDRSTSSARHPGEADPGKNAPPDHLILDLFHLPIIEPYAISEPFSTSGKVNLNHVMAPFGYAEGDSGSNPNTSVKRSYIRRDTALRGVLKSVKMMVVPTNQVDGGHTEAPLNVTNKESQFRYDINLDQTLAAIEERIKDTKDRGIFRSASEICNVDLVPQQLTPTPSTSIANWGTFWDTSYSLTGDNMRERPYSHIYPRITTKSNVYTVHVRAQSIRKMPNSDPEVFEEGRDSIAGEYRGSTIVERFIDPNDPNLKNYKWDDTQGKGRLDPYYRFRIVGTKQFTAH